MTDDAPAEVQRLIEQARKFRGELHGGWPAAYQFIDTLADELEASAARERAAQEELERLKAWRAKWLIPLSKKPGFNQVVHLMGDLDLMRAERDAAYQAALRDAAAVAVEVYARSWGLRPDDDEMEGMRAALTDAVRALGEAKEEGE